mgnify:CR=1 FL=1
MKTLLQKYIDNETSVAEQDQLIHELYLRYCFLKGAIIGALIVAGLCWFFG